MKQKHARQWLLTTKLTWNQRRPDSFLDPFLAHLILTHFICTLGLPESPFPAMTVPLLGRPTIFSAPWRSYPTECTQQRTLSPPSSLPRFGRKTILMPRIVMAWATFYSLPTPRLNRLRATSPSHLHSLLQYDDFIQDFLAIWYPSRCLARSTQ